MNTRTVTKINIISLIISLCLGLVLIASLTLGLVGCGSAKSPTSTTPYSGDSNQYSNSNSNPVPVMTGSPAPLPAVSGVAPYRFSFALHGTAGGSTPPPSSYSATSQTFTVKTDSILKVNLLAQTMGSIAVFGTGGSIIETDNGYFSQCYQYSVNIGSQRPLTLMVFAGSSDGTGTCPDGTVASPSYDFSAELNSPSSAAVTVTISNPWSYTCGSSGIFQQKQCYLNAMQKSYTTFGTLIVHTNGTQ